MEFDYSNPLVGNGFILFPEFAFVDTPKQANQIEETFYVQGTQGGVSISITGSTQGGI